MSAPDIVSATLYSALDGLSLRQRVAADNVSNIDTPGFRAATVDFESTLRSAAAAGSTAAVTPSTGWSSAPAGPDGNNVDLATETMTAMRSVFQYQLVTRAVDDRFALVKTALGGM